MTDFSDQFRKIIMRYKRIGYDLNVMRQSACLIINPIMVDGYARVEDRVDILFSSKNGEHKHMKYTKYKQETYITSIKDKYIEKENSI